MILLTIAIAVATFVSALALRDSVERTAVASYRALSGESELEATLTTERSAYFLTADSAEYQELLSASEAYGEVRSGYLFYASIGASEGVFAEVYATDLSLLESYNPIRFLSGEARRLRTGVVLSRSFAERIGAKTGDLLTATRYGSSQEVALTVIGVAEERGVFAEADALLTEETASRLLSLGDGVRVYNRFFIDLSDEKMKSVGANSEQATEAIRGALSAFTLSSPVNDANVRITLSYQSTLLFVIAAIVAALGAVLIYTAVSLVMKNRVSVASLFKSVGADSAAISFYLLAEVLIYGIVGSGIGIAGSYGVGAIFGAMTGMTASFSLGWGAALFGVLFGVILGLLSALVPVLKLSFAPLYDMLHAHSPIVRVKKTPAILASGIFLALFLGTAFAGTSSAFLLGTFASLALLALLFTAMPFAVKGVAALCRKIASDKPSFGKLELAACGVRNNRHSQSGARLLAIAVAAVMAVAVLIGESTAQLRAFERLFRADIMISADKQEIAGIAAEVREEEGVSGAFLAYVENRCALAGEEGNTVTLLAARGQEYEEVFRAREFGVDVPAIVGVRKAAMGGGLAMKLGLEVGDAFVVTVDGAPVTFTLAALIDTPLTIVFTDLNGLGVQPNFCLAAGEEGAFGRLSEKYALRGAVYHTADAFGYVIDLASAYLKVFSLFEGLVFLFAIAGYAVTAIASFRDRRREYRLLSACGASRSDIRSIVTLENVMVVLAAAIAGAASAFLLLFLVQNMLKSLGLYFTLLG